MDGRPEGNESGGGWVTDVSALMPGFSAQRETGASGGGGEEDTEKHTTKAAPAKNTPRGSGIPSIARALCSRCTKKKPKGGNE